MRILAVAWTLAFWLSCVVAPLVAVLLRVKGSVQFFDPLVLATVRATVVQAFWSTAISSLLGLGLGLYAARVEGRIGRWTRALLSLPSGVPTVVAATAWVAWLGRSGWLAQRGLHLDWLYSFSAVILAHVFFNAPWVALQIAQARRTIPRGQLEAALTLGASRWQSFSAVIWPHLKWTWASASAQVFALCSMSFALVLILGGGPPVDTLETALYSRVRGGGLDLSGAAACAAWEVLITLVPWALVLVLRSQKGEAALDVDFAELASPEKFAFKNFSALIAFALALVFIIPYFAVLNPSHVTHLFVDQWDELRSPLFLSLRLAFAVGVGTVLTAAAATLALSGLRRPSFCAVLLSLPSGVSVLVLGLGAWLAYGRWLDPFEGSFAAMWALQVTLFFPLALRMLWPVAQAAQKNRFEAALTLGASPWRAFWTVEWPRWRAPVGSTLAIVTAGALGEVAAVSLFYSEALIPLPLVVTRWMGQYRFDEANAAAGVLLLVSMAVALVSKGVLNEGE